MSSLGSPLAVAPCAAALLLALGCASAPPQATGLPGEEVLERGGELREQWPERSLEVTEERVRVWGISEVPEGSRLQLALSGVDAITRAELLKAVRVRVQAVLLDVESSAAQRGAAGPETLSLQITESVSGMLDRAGPLPHGWARIRRGDRVVLRLWARLDVQRSALEAALRAPLSRAGRDAGAFVRGLTLGEEARAP